MSNRRGFLKKVVIGTTGVTVGASSFSAKSYAKIVGANDRINVAFMGCGRRVPGYFPAITNKSNNVDLAYICVIMQSQREKVAENLFLSNKT